MKPANRVKREEVCRMEVVVGKEFKINAISNPSTGFSWSARTSSEKLEICGQTFVSSSLPFDMIGAGGMQVFSFVAREPGEYTIRMVYSHAWMEKKDNPMEKVYIIRATREALRA